MPSDDTLPDRRAWKNHLKEDEEFQRKSSINQAKVDHVLFGDMSIGEKGMKDQLTEVHSRQGVQVTQMADLLRALRGDPLTGEIGLIKKLELQEQKMGPVLDAWKAMKWLFGGILAFATLLGAITVIKKFFPHL